MLLGLAGITLICLIGFAAWFPAVAAVAWILLLETSPDEWLSSLGGNRETIIGALKAAGIGLALLMALRDGVKTDRYNPSFAFVAMFFTGLLHGLYPGLDVTGSLRSLIGSAAPFMFGFVRLPVHWIRAVTLAAIAGPAIAVAFGFALFLAGLHSMYALEQGALRLGASGEPPFLAGFALIGIYAGLVEFCGTSSAWTAATLLLNFTILILTGARAPLAFAVALTFLVLVLQRRLMALAACGAALCLGLIFAGSLHFIRVVDMFNLGEAGNLSNRNLVWPYFIAAIKTSPWVGWGEGAGKVVVPVTSSLHALIGTNAAHDEYLRIGAEGGVIGLALLIGLMTLWVIRGTAGLPGPQRWLMRGVYIAFALHSATDNTLIATTSSVFFIWVCSIFATPQQERKAGS
jgi:O-antigen ligase